MNSRYKQGRFKPKNPEKYRGDLSNIIYRSSLELRLMTHLDENENVIQWGSEPFFIPYKSPVDHKMHRYFPDFIIKKRNAEGVVETLIVEVKPNVQTKVPVMKYTETGRKKRSSIRDVAVYMINEAKWRAAEKYCETRGYKWQILTEKQLSIK